MCSRVWNTHTGETLLTLQHNHIVRAVAFPHNSSALLATGGMEKKLRIFDIDGLSQHEVNTNGNSANGNSDGITPADKGYEIGAGIHQGAIKSIIWTHDRNVLVTVSDDKTIRWWDLQNNTLIQQKAVQGDIGSCEFSAVTGGPQDLGNGYPVLTIAAGKTIYFYGGPDARTLLKTMELPYAVASAAIHPIQGKVVVGGSSVNDTSVRVYDYDSEQEIG